jgi:acyl-CoA synthetase (AMP-forming)/AMP-acid ligase II
MIISGGFNVYANEVEAAINSHEAILMSAVVGIPDEEWGEAIHAEVVLKQNQELDADVLKVHIRDQLGGYKTPKSVAFVPELPLSVAGKVLRKDVRKKYWTDENRKVS